MDKQYCVYSGEETSDPSLEHVLPLSLGGHNDFCIQVDRDFNNQVGSKVDGAISNDFLVLFDRDKNNAKGHSRKQPIPRIRSVKLANGEPAQAEFGKEGLKIFDVKAREYLEKSDSRGSTINVNGSIDLDAPLRFVAKVALGAGQYVYGDRFVEHVELDNFRTIMNMKRSEGPKPCDALVYDRFHATEDGFTCLLRRSQKWVTVHLL